MLRRSRGERHFGTRRVWSLIGDNLAALGYGGYGWQKGRAMAIGLALLRLDLVGFRVLGVQTTILQPILIIQFHEKERGLDVGSSRLNESLPSRRSAFALSKQLGKNIRICQPCGLSRRCRERRRSNCCLRLDSGHSCMQFIVCSRIHGRRWP